MDRKDKKLSHSALEIIKRPEVVELVAKDLKRKTYTIARYIAKNKVNGPLTSVIVLRRLESLGLTVLDAWNWV